MNTTLQKTLITLALSALALSAFAAEPNACTSEPKAKWLQDKEVKVRLEKQDYTVRRVKTNGTCYEAYVQGKDGKKAELFINPVDGTLVKEVRQP